MERCSVYCESLGGTKKAHTLRSNCSSGGLIQSGEKCIPGFRYWYSEVYFFILKVKDHDSGFNWKTYKLIFPTVLVCLQEITTRKEPSCDNSITTRVCLLLPLALHSDVFVLTSSSHSNYSSGPGAGSSSAVPMALPAPLPDQIALMMMGKAAAGNVRNSS